MPMILLAIPEWVRRIKHPQHIRSGYARTGAIWKPGLLKTLRAGGTTMKKMHQLTRSSNIASALKDRPIFPSGNNSLETGKFASETRGLLVHARSIHISECDCLFVSS